MTDQEHLMNSLKKEVRSLLTPIKEGLTPFQLEKEYKSMIGEQLPFRMLGYHSVMELVKDMPEVVNICPVRDGTVILKAIADESTKKIASLVARQKPGKYKSQFPKHRINFSLPSTSRSGLPRCTQFPLSLPCRGRVPPTLPAVVKSELKDMLQYSPVLLSDFDKAFVQRFGRSFEFMRYGFLSMSEVLNAASDIVSVVQTRAGSLLMLKEVVLKKKTEKLSECKMAIQSDKTKQTPAPLPAPAAKVASSVLPVGSLSLISDQKSDTLQMQTELVETPLIRSNERMRQLEEEMKIALAQEGPGGIVSSELKEKIKIIVAQHPKGLCASKLPAEFEEHFHEKLPIRKLGFLDLMELVGALNDVLRIECKEGKQDWLIFDIDSLCLPGDEETNGKTEQSCLVSHQETSDKHELHSWDFPLKDSTKLETKFNVVTKMMTPHLGIEKYRIMQEIMTEEIPPDAVQDGTLYSLPQLGNSALVGLFVEHIVSPSQFYIRISSGGTSDNLENIMIEMRRCYSSKNVADRYVIPEAFVHPGQLCCVRDSEDKWWYRVIIHQLLNDEEVEVFYPDFGNMRIVKRSSLRFLKYCYAKLPAQVIPCSLAWVKPTKADWTVSAVLDFQRLCELKQLVGVVDEYINGILHLFLCDTSSDDDIYFHSVLRLEGHALICRENIPSKGFRELNPFALYVKPSPNQQAGFTEVDTSLFQQQSVIDFPGTRDPEPCNNEVVLQHPTNLCSDPELPYLEPVNLCKEIWDENWMPSMYYEEKKNSDAFDKVCADIIVVSHNTPSGGGSKDETQHNQDLNQKIVDASTTTVLPTKYPSLEPLNENLNSSAGVEENPSVGPMSDTSSQTLQEFYVSIAQSKKSGKPSESDAEVNKLPTQGFQPLPSPSALDSIGDASSEKKVSNAPGTQAVSLYNANSYSEFSAVDHNALVFTAELQGSAEFCIPCSPTVALGASARLATSGGYFSHLRKVKI